MIAQHHGSLAARPREGRKVDPIVRQFIVQEQFREGEWLDDPDQPDDYTHGFEQAKWWMENDNKTCRGHATTYAHRIIERTESQVWPNTAPSLEALVGGFGRNNERNRDMKNQGDKVAASVTVYRVGDMTTRGRKAVCGWLRKLADDLQNEPEAFAKTFRARYLYPANAPAQGREAYPAAGCSQSGSEEA